MPVPLFDIEAKLVSTMKDKLFRWVATQLSEEGLRGYSMISRTLTYLVFSLLLSLVAIDSVRAQQSKLPACPKAPVAEWDNCFGTWSDGKGSSYVGDWKNGTFDGRGTATLSHGSVYFGDFKYGKQNGQGTATFVNGDKYVGEFKNNYPSGQGTATYANGNKYVGEEKDGKANGQGTFTYANGDKYVGDFRDGKQNGQGTSTYANVGKYVGEFKDGFPSGQGTFTYANGDKHVGEFKDGFPNGQGTITFATGGKYVGEWKDGKENGRGILYAASGSIIEQGVYENGVLTKTETALPQVSANTHRVQLVKEVGIYTVPVLINDVLMLHFVVDSGAADVTIPADVVMTLIRTGTIKDNDFIGNQKYQLADGSVIDSKQFIIRSLKVGDQIVENVNGSVGDVKGSLLLGQSFLEKFKSWSMDNASHELVLE